MFCSSEFGLLIEQAIYRREDKSQQHDKTVIMNFSVCWQISVAGVNYYLFDETQIQVRLQS